MPNGPTANMLGTGTEQDSGVPNDPAVNELEAITRGMRPPTSMITNDGGSSTPRTDHNP